MIRKRALLIAWITSGALLPATAVQWEAVPPLPPLPSTTWDVEPLRTSREQAHRSSPAGLDWQLDPEPIAMSQLLAIAWESVPSEEVIDPEAAISQQLVSTPKLPVPASGPTYANFRALWRDEDWLPQISSLVPVGFGPKGVMLTLYGRGIDCNTGKGECPGFTTYSAWQDSLNTLASGQLEQVIGFGDPIKAVSVVFSNSSEKLASQIKNGSFDSDSLLTGNQTGVAVVKAFGPDSSIRTGIENLIRWDSNNAFYDPLSFYAVFSQRIRINDNRSPWFSSAYITAGIGNGDFRPIEQIFLAQTKALRDAGCETYGYQPKKPCSTDTFNRAIQSGSNYGQINPIASLGLEVYNGINLISEWTGRNLNLGVSWRPIPGFGLVITPMVQSLVQNCEYPGCQVKVPDYDERVPLPSSVLTQRARLSLQASLEFKF